METMQRLGDPLTIIQGYLENLLDGMTVSYTHLRAHETVLALVCRLLLETKKIHTRTLATNKSQTV